MNEVERFREAVLAVLAEMWQEADAVYVAGTECRGDADSRFAAEGAMDALTDAIEAIKNLEVPSC